MIINLPYLLDKSVISISFLGSTGVFFTFTLFYTAFDDYFSSISHIATISVVFAVMSP